MASAHAPVKVSAQRKLTGFTSDYVFIRYAGADELKTYDLLDIGLFGESWATATSWAVVFVPGVTENNWREHLPPPKSDILDTHDVVYIVASGYVNGLFRHVDKAGPYKKGGHGFRTVVRLNEFKLDSRVTSDGGGSLLLKIDFRDQDGNGAISVLDTTWTFDGQVYWSLYWK